MSQRGALTNSDPTDYLVERGEFASLIERIEMPDAEYHTVTPEGNPPTRVDVWHDNNNCNEGKRISVSNRSSGRGDAKRRCELC